MTVKTLPRQELPRPSFFVPSDDLLNRMIAAYRFSHQTFGQTDAYMWKMIFAKQRDLHEVLINSRSTALREMLADPGRTYLYYGVDNLFPENIALLAGSKASRDDLDRLTLQSLAAMLKTIGADAAEGAGIERQLEALDAAAGQHFIFPNVFRNEFGIATSRGLVTYRSVQAIYQALRLRSMVDARADQRIIEIGGGMGRTCYYANCLGLHSYTIVDLPMTLIGQALFLASTLGEASFRLPGEAVFPGAYITLALPGQMPSLGEFAVAINVDSLTEMSHAQASEYFRLMRKQCGALLSINHEDNYFFVRDFERPISRQSFSLRDGYFEEVYTFLSEAASSPVSIASKHVYRRWRKRISRIVALTLR